MKLHGLARVRNEGDVIEEFVRYNLRFLDELTVIDNASVDGTPAVLQALANEGLPLTVISEPTFPTLQSETMTLWARRLVEQRSWDFLFLLDADEFVKAPSRAALIASLAALPPDTNCLLPWSSYVVTAEDDAAVFPVLERVPYRRMYEGDPPSFKAVLSRTFAEKGAFVVAEGNHGIERWSDDPAPQMLNDVRLAHFPVRSIAQIQLKVLVGWSGYLSLGYERSGFAWHQERLFRELESKPDWTAHDLQRTAMLYQAAGQSQHVPLTFDPLPPVGVLRYRDAALTNPLQAAARYVRQLAAIIAERKRPDAHPAAPPELVRAHENGHA